MFRIIVAFFYDANMKRTRVPVISYMHELTKIGTDLSNTICTMKYNRCFLSVTVGWHRISKKNY